MKNQEWPENNNPPMPLGRRLRIGIAIIGTGFALILGGCATSENQQIILANMAAQTADRAAEQQFIDGLKQVQGDPAAVVALSLSHAYHKAPTGQKVETARGYLHEIGRLALDVLPFVHSVGDRKKDSDNVSAGRDVIINSDKHDSLRAGQGIETGIKRDGNVHSDSQPTTTITEFAPPEEGGEE